MFEKSIAGVANTVEGLNSKLLATFRLIQSIRGVDAATEIIENNTAKKGIDQTTRTDLSALILEQLTALSTQGGPEALRAMLEQMTTFDYRWTNVFGAKESQ
jgi:hypothetical protein